MYRIIIRYRSQRLIRNKCVFYVKVDQQQVLPPGEETSWTNSKTGVLPPKRSLNGWLRLSQGDTSNLSKQYPPFIKGDNNQMDNRIIDYRYQPQSYNERNRARPPEWTGQCVAHSNQQSIDLHYQEQFTSRKKKLPYSSKQTSTANSIHGTNKKYDRKMKAILVCILHGMLFVIVMIGLKW